MKRIITVNTDASFDHVTGAGGYGIWITITGKRIHYSGSFKEKLSTCDEAERAAIVNAMAIIAIDIKGEFDILHFNTDSANAIHHFKEKHKKQKDKYNHAFGKYLKDIKQNLGIKKFRFKHVKAHGKSEDARGYVNNWCDAEAKKKMREKRQTIINESSVQ